MPKAYGYARVSSDKQARSGLSLEGQDQQIMDYYERTIKHRGVEWGGMVVDPAVSATRKKFRDRPGGEVLFRCLQPGDHVIFARLDRGFRKARDFLEVYEDLIDRGVVVHIMQLGLDTSNELMQMMAKMLAVIAAIFAEMESQNISQRVKVAHGVLRRRGRLISRQPGLLYKMGPGKKLVLDDRQLGLGSIIDYLVGQGRSYKQIARTMNDDGTLRIPRTSEHGATPQGKPWEARRVEELHLAWRKHETDRKRRDLLPPLRASRLQKSSQQ